MGWLGLGKLRQAEPRSPLVNDQPRKTEPRKLGDFGLSTQAEISPMPARRMWQNRGSRLTKNEQDVRHRSAIAFRALNLPDSRIGFVPRGRCNSRRPVASHTLLLRSWTTPIPKESSKRHPERAPSQVTNGLWQVFGVIWRRSSAKRCIQCG